MKILNASAWPIVGNSSLEEVIYCSGSYPGGLPALWRKKQKAFACVRYDRRCNKITAWRDHFGLEPLYYYYDGRQFLFGSSMPDIIKHLSKHPNLNTARVLNECFAADQANTPAYSNETFYKGIYRVEPGHSLSIQSENIHSESFWQLDLNASPIYYAHDQEYLEHFIGLLDEAIQVQTQGVKSLAAEFSGGLDSSAVITGCHRLGVKPALFSHIAYPGTEEKDDLTQVRCVLKHFKLNDIHYVDAKDFDPIAVFDELALVFAGTPCYVFFMLANNIHQAVQKGGYTTLLSGFGGDECVSGYARNLSFYPELLGNSCYRKAWHEMTCQLQAGSIITPSKIKIFLNLLRYVNPILFKLFSHADDLYAALKAYFGSKPIQPRTQGYPYCRSVRQFEHSQLQGRLSNHVRMRVEYSAVIAKHFGFSYAYPLLYPKLVEYCYRLPVEQKRRNGVGRYLIRQYLAEHLPATVYAHNSKKGDIMPATRHKYKEYLKTGKLDPYFKNLPFQQHINQISIKELHPLSQILAYMIKHYQEKKGLLLA